MQSGEILGNSAKRGGGVYFGADANPKTNGIIYGNDAEEGYSNVASITGDAVYWESGHQWRGITVNPTDNHDTYGFWLND